MTISKSTMKEIIESGKQIIERVSKELAYANETIQILTSNIIEHDKEDYEKLIKERDKYKEYKDKMELILVNLGIQNKFEDFLSFIGFLYDKKDKFMQFLDLEKNKNRNI